MAQRVLHPFPDQSHLSHEADVLVELFDVWTTLLEEDTDTFVKRVERDKSAYWERHAKSIRLYGLCDVEIAFSSSCEVTGVYALG